MTSIMELKEGKYFMSFEIPEYNKALFETAYYKEKRPLMPDTIMIYNDKYYVLDAKEEDNYQHWRGRNFTKTS